MHVYLAASYKWKEKIKEVAKALEEQGHIVTSTWFMEPHKPSVKLADVTPEELQKLASRDLDEIDAAEGLVFFAEDQNNQPPRGGRHVEFGYALGKGKKIFVIGGRENIFHHLPQVTVEGDWTNLPRE